MAEKILLPLRKFPRTAFFMYLLGFIILVIIHQGGRHVSVFELLVDVYMLCLLLSLLPKTLARWAKGLVYVIAYGRALVDMFCYTRFGTPITPGFLRICLETNQQEATEALATYVTPQSLLSPVLLILLLMAVHILTAMRKRKREQTIAIGRKAAWAGVAILLFSVVVSAKNMVFIARCLTEPKTGLEMEYAMELPHSGGFYQPFYRLLHSCKAMLIERDAVVKLESNADKVQVDSCSMRSPDIVLIIGEAYSRHHSQLYGYRQPTTPCQQQLAQDSSLVVFTDVVSPFHQTSEVFRLAFSLYAYGEKGEWSDYALFPQLFRKGGYQVTFITNQFAPSPSFDIFEFNGSLFLNTEVLSQSLFSHRNTQMHDYDMALLHDYDSLSRYRTDHNLTIFHLKGQHCGYKERYPESEERFTAGDYSNRQDLEDFNRNELANYDNACLYNDKVVTTIVGRFKNQEAIVIYMPDHGEMCFDGSDTYGRTLAVNTRNEVEQQFEIPFWIWMSVKYRERHPDICQQVLAAKDRPFMTDNIDQVLLYLGGIACPDYREQDNVLSPRYNAGRKRMLMGTMNYDAVMKDSTAATE